MALFGPGRSRQTDELRMTFGEHLEELRWRLIKALLGVVVGAIIAFVYAHSIFEFLLQPLYVALASHGQTPELTALRPADVFSVYLRMGIMVGIVIACPWVLYQLWAFVAAGLYPNERRFVHLFGPFSLILFGAGLAFCYYAVVPVSLSFLVGFSSMFPTPEGEPTGLQRLLLALKPQPAQVERPRTISGPTLEVLTDDPVAPQSGQIWVDQAHNQLRVYIPDAGDTGQTGRPGGRIWSAPLVPAHQRPMVRPAFALDYYIDFITTMGLGFGVGFQVPIAVIFLAWSRIVSIEALRRARRLVIFAIFAVAALLAPPDIQSMLLLAVPMCLLYELGLLLARVLPKRMPRHEGA